MNPRIALPFLTLSDDAILASSWSISLDGTEWMAGPERIDDWDAHTHLWLRRNLRVDPVAAAANLGLPPGDLQLRVTARVGTGKGRVPRHVLLDKTVPVDPATLEAQFEIQVSGEGLAMLLHLRTDVTLAAVPGTCGSLSPKAVGARVWFDTVQIQLEGDEPRFPIELVDLAELLADARGRQAPWYLHWSPRDWNRDFHGAVRLYVNTRTEEMCRRIEEQDRLTLQLLLAEAMSQICERLVLDGEANHLMAAPEPGSLAAQAVSWLDKAWPGKDMIFLRSVLETRPGIFRAGFLALAELSEI